MCEIFSSEMNLKYMFEMEIAESGYDFDHDYSDRFWIDLEDNQIYNVTKNSHQLHQKLLM